MTTEGSRLRETVRDEDRVRIRSLLEKTGFFSAAEVAVALELVDDALAAGASSDYRFLFLEEQDEIAGYACFGPIPLTASSWDLYWIAVGRARQGKGVGRLLLEGAERRIRRLGGAQVFVDTSSRPQYAPTRAFYEACGYEAAAVLEDFYAPGDGKVIYRRRI